jgi:SAM-dependent methyltransferase
MISYSIRRIAQMRYFSRSPLAGSELRVRRRPPDDTLDLHVDDAVDLSVRQWSLYRDTWFVEFRVTPRPGGPKPTNAQVVFRSCSIEIPIAAGGTTHIALPMPATHLGERVGLAIELSDGRTVVDWEPGARALRDDLAALLFDRFAAELRARPAGEVLEIGSRARSGNTYRHIVPPDWAYTGMDVRTGTNVDVVGDAHDISAVVGHRRFDAVFSVSVFEHLLMPWKAVLEINRVLEPGGLVYVATHQSFPMHDEPWDFWRFSNRAWEALFNSATGFELIDTAMGERAAVVPDAVVDSTRGTWSGPAFLLSCALGRKTGDTTLTWPVDVTGVITESYPH